MKIAGLVEPKERKIFSQNTMNKYNQVVQHHLCKHIYIVNTKMILKMDGDHWDMLNQTVALKHRYTKMILSFVPA